MKSLPKTQVFNLVPWSDVEFEHAKITGLNFQRLRNISNDEVLKAVVLDCETATEAEGAGITLGKDTVVELTMVKVSINRRTGELLSIDSVLSQLNEPPFPITQETTDITGITQELVAGKKFNHTLAEDFVKDVELIIAHNASFDRPMIEGLTSTLSDKVWACSCKGDINWYEHGFSSSGLEYLVFKHQAYYPAHRAAPDCFALIHLLSSNPNALYELLQSAYSSTYNVTAVDAPFHIKDDLKSIGMKPLYVGGKFIHWQLQSLTEDKAMDLLGKLESLYKVDRSKALEAVPIGRRYALAVNG